VSSSSAAAPIFFVRVPGKKPRPCVDYRGLNAMTIRDSYPIPILGQLLNQLQGCQFFTKIDLKAAFNLLRVAKGHEWKTAFRTPWGLYEYLVMPFGLANAPACFQRFIQHVLREMLNISCFVYIDDILIFSKTRSEHQEHVTRVLQKLQEHSLFASPEKCSFYSDKVSFLGFAISAEGIKMEDSKLSTILDWPYPVNLKELNRFLGFINFYRKFIQQFSDVAAPLTSLTRLDVDVASALLSAESRSSFESLKDCFRNAPLLQHFDFGKLRILYVDSSKYALSAVLSQKDDSGVIRPVSFLSKKWTDNESSWQVHDQELGAIVQAFIEWRAWLIDTKEPVEVMSDHSNLRYFMKSKNLSDRQARWAAYLTSFHFVIKHIPGRNNPADPGSRRPDFLPAGEEADSKRLMFEDSPRGLQLAEGQSLDTGQELEIGEVVTSEDPPPSEQLDTDFFFCPPSAELTTLLRRAYEKESPAAAEIEGLSKIGNLWWLRGRVFVPPSLRPRVLQQFHDNPLAGHLGSMKTLDLLSRTVAWPGIRKDVASYTKSCFSCQRAKHSTQKPPGQLHSLQIPD
jgi:hypothetical protein